MAGVSFVDALLSPRSIALVGASGDPGKNTSRPQRYLRKHGYGGRIYPINLNRSEVLGERAYPNLAAVPYPIDHAYIMVPARAVAEVIADCASANIPVATIFSDGFAEAGEAGRYRQQQIIDIARAGGVRLLGPNSVGVINTHAAMALSVNAVLELPELAPGTLSVVSQSGSLLGTLLSRGQARGIGFSKLISVGNEADLGVAAIADALVDDPDTSAILLFLETLRDPEPLAAMARRAFASHKPVIVYKLGRSSAGQQLALSHTGAIAGSDSIADAFFRHHGLIRVDMLETLFELPALLKDKRPAAGRRVAVVTTTGGGAALVADRLGTLGMELVTPPDSLVDRLAGLGLRINSVPVIDLTMAGTNQAIYGAALDELLTSSTCDVVVAVVGSSGQFHPELAVEPIVSAAMTDKPLAAFIAPQADRSLELLGQAGVAAFRTPEACADAVRAYLDWSPPQDQSPTQTELAAAAATLAAAQGPTLDEAAALAVFAALGIPSAPLQVLRDPNEVSRIGYPVAAKVLSSNILHKTEAGGVILNIANDEELRAAHGRILARVREIHPEAQIHGILIQRMQHGLAEVLLGFRHSEMGPVVTLGTGGVLAEIYDDCSIRMAPVGLATARQMIEEVRGLALIRGYRSQPLGDCEALAAAICALSDLARLKKRKVLEAEINPLMVKASGEGVVAVDGLIVCGDSQNAS